MGSLLSIVPLEPNPGSPVSSNCLSFSFWIYTPGSFCFFSFSLFSLLLLLLPFFFLLLLLLLSLIVLFYPLPPLFLSFLIPSSFTEGEGETEQASLTYLFLLIMKLTNTPPTHTQELSCPYGLIEQVYQPHMLLRRPSRYLSLGERP